MSFLEPITITWLSRSQEVVDTLSRNLSKHTGYKFKYLAKDITGIDDLINYDVCVSPANSYGELKGGVDMQYYKYFGDKKLQDYIYKMIMNKYYGEVLVGDSCLVNLYKVDKTDELTNKYLLLCPTMTVPMDINNTRNVYYFTRALIKGLATMRHLGISCNKVLIPVPGVGVGCMDCKTASKQISAAFSAYEKKGIIYAIYGPKYIAETNIESTSIYPEFSDSVAQNSKIAYLQLAK